MNFGDLEVQSVQRRESCWPRTAHRHTDVDPDNRPQIQRVHTDDNPVTPLAVRLEADPAPSFASSNSEPTTVIRWETPPQFAAPTPPHTYPVPPQYPQRVLHTPEFIPSSPQPYPIQNQYVKGTLHTPYQTPELTPRQTPGHSSGRSIETLRRSAETLTRPKGHRKSVGDNAAYASHAPLVRFDEEQIRDDQQAALSRDRDMDTIIPDLSPPTPNVDDTPYIRFAIEQLTRDEEVKQAERRGSPASSDTYPVERVIPDYGLGYMTPEGEREALALARKHRSSPGGERLFNFNGTRPLSSAPEADSPRIIQYDTFRAVETPASARYPDLTFVPTILRPFSMIILSCLCLLMIVLLMASAIYSSSHGGIMNWNGGIYGGRYFLFSFFPQILAACIFVYIQEVMSAVTRIMPFTLMAMDNAECRQYALFLGMFQRTMLWPRLTGLMIIDVTSVFLWLSVFTIPLTSCLFSVKQFGNEWRWTTVQGVAWSLFALYVLILGAILITTLFFFRRTTGLIWDAKSLADIIALLPKSNALRRYPGTDSMRNKEDIRHHLGDRNDRLGYWETRSQAQGTFYCIGEEGGATRQYTLDHGKLQEKRPIFGSDEDGDVEKGENFDATIQSRYIPWYLKDTFVILWVVTAFVFLLAIFVVSFLHSTAIHHGFLPHVPVLCNSAGFSPANFLYSFIPSLLGMLLYLLFQPLDMAFRILKPWSELSNQNGATAASSLLLDYPARLPLNATLTALTRGHFRIALLSLLSFFFILLPILAGGLFFPLTIPDGSVHMIPNLTAFYIILILLILYFFGLVAIVPGRKRMMMPHGVDCLAEVISFLYASRLVQDAAFQSLRSKRDLVTRLMAERTGWADATERRGGVNSFRFGMQEGANGRWFLGVEKMGRR